MKITITKWHFACQWWCKMLIINKCSKSKFTVDFRENYWVSVIYGVVKEYWGSDLTSTAPRQKDKTMEQVSGSWVETVLPAAVYKIKNELSSSKLCFDLSYFMRFTCRYHNAHNVLGNNWKKRKNDKNSPRKKENNALERHTDKACLSLPQSHRLHTDTHTLREQNEENAHTHIQCLFPSAPSCVLLSPLTSHLSWQSHNDEYIRCHLPSGTIMPWFQHSLWFDIGHNPDSACQPHHLISPVTQCCPTRTCTYTHTHTLFSSVRGQPSLIPIEDPFSGCAFFLPSQAWVKRLNNKRCLPWPLRQPFFPRRERKKKSSISPSNHLHHTFLRPSPKSVLSTCSAPFPWDSHEAPVAPAHPPSQCRH